MADGARRRRTHPPRSRASASLPVIRVAFFVLAVAGLVYLAIEAVLRPWLGLELDRAFSVCLSVIAGILAWTLFLWRMADRLGRRENAWHDDGEGRDRS